MNEEESIGKRLKRLRKEQGLTQAELAKEAKLSQSAIGNIESEQRGYGASVVLIAKALKTTPEFLQMVGRGSRSEVTVWPFDLFTLTDFLTLPEQQQIEIENSIAGAILRAQKTAEALRKQA